jgi:heme exporter protein A
VIAPGVAEVEAAASEKLRSLCLEAATHLLAVVDHEPEVTLLVRGLASALGEHEELVADIDEGHTGYAAAQLELEDAPVEVQALGEVAHLEDDMVDADEPCHSRRITSLRSRPSRLLAHRLLAVAAIELDGLERRYGERVALTGVSVRVDEGQTLAVLGGNGAGKTTLLRVLAGLLRPHAGRAVVLGAELPRERWKLPGRVGYLGHEPLLYRELSGRENLRYHARLHGIPRARVDVILRAVGMDRRAGDPVRELSQGMVQRLAVARAVLHEPELLLLDEPRANLDSAASEQLEPLIGRSSGRTRVLVSHDVRGTLAEADVVLRLRQGRPAPADEEIYA